VDEGLADAFMEFMLTKSPTIDY